MKIVYYESTTSLQNSRTHAWSRNALINFLEARIEGVDAILR